MKRVIAVVGLVAALGCGFKLPPIPWPEPPAPRPICPGPDQGLDPRNWCGCWENSGRTDGKWKWTGDCPTPAPDPTPTPTPEPPAPEPPIVCPPDTTPQVDPTTGEVVGCLPYPTPTPTPTPAPEVFPFRFPLPGTRIFFNNKPHGQGLDSTPKAQGDPDLCLAIHGVRVNVCHFDSETGWPGGQEQRARYEMRVLAGARAGDPAAGPMLCPVWQWQRGAVAVPCSDDRSPAHPISCDHFGHDDPHTAAYEGVPAECGAQRDEFGPAAGFWVRPQGNGQVRACPPLDTAGPNCGPWVTR